MAGSYCLYDLFNPLKTTIDRSSEHSSEREAYAVMAGTALPGRPGNLTVEQEIRLQEMWTATLSIFGVPVLGENTDGDTVSTTGSVDRARPEAVTLEKKKKKRINMFSKKTHDDADIKDMEGISGADSDDKYGQAKAFRVVLDSQTPVELRSAFWSMVKHDNPDGLLLRFLRARKWEVHKALVMLVATMNWRMKEMHVDDDIVKRGEEGSIKDSASSNETIKKDGEDFLMQMRLGKSFLHGTDREGRPICFVRVRLHKQGEQTESSLERYTVYTIETARYFLQSNVDTAVCLPFHISQRC